MSSENWAFETRQIHIGQTPDGDTGSRALPIYQTTSFVFDSAETAANRFGLAGLGPIYTRIGNLTAQIASPRSRSASVRCCSPPCRRLQRSPFSTSLRQATTSSRVRPSTAARTTCRSIR